VRIKVRASEIVNLESVKASGHGFLLAVPRAAVERAASR